MFASPVAGGEFNYTAEVQYPDTGHSVAIQMISKVSL